jgi:hypothetical protein
LIDFKYLLQDEIDKIKPILNGETFDLNIYTPKARDRQDPFLNGFFTSKQLELILKIEEQLNND